jgi:hypothetical protein
MLPQRPDSEPTGLLHTVRLELDHFVGDRRRILIFRVEERNGEKKEKPKDTGSGRITCRDTVFRI